MLFLFATVRNNLKRFGSGCGLERVSLATSHRERAREVPISLHMQVFQPYTARVNGNPE